MVWDLQNKRCFLNKILGGHLRSNFVAFKMQPITPYDTVANVMHQCPLNVSFQKALVEDKMIFSYNPIAEVANIQLSNERTFCLEFT